MAIELHDGALWDLRDASQAYEAEKTGLGDRFLDSVLALSERLEDFPRRGLLLAPAESEEPEFRSMRLGRFPYKLIYAIDGDRLVLLAVAHDKRRTGYWLGRVDSLR